MTGGWGFIGSAFIRSLDQDRFEVVNIDTATYAADRRRLEGSAVRTHEADVADELVRDAVRDEAPEIIVHFAAETHVTRSETDEPRFLRTNVQGTRNLLEAAVAAETKLFLHVSTDEVYGPCHGGPFKEDDKLPGEGLATSAYARSKALADDLARSFSDRLGVIVGRPTNCFGPWQHPEKAIPRWTIRGLRGKPIPVWGDGLQVRDWMSVEDCVAALSLLVTQGRPGEVYNIGPERHQRTNLEIAQWIATATGVGERAVYCTEYDRPQHDRRYAIDASKLKALGWRPRLELQNALARTVEWYRRHEEWWMPLMDEAERLYDDRNVRASGQ